MAIHVPITGAPSRASFSYLPRPAASQAASIARCGRNAYALAFQAATYPSHWTDAERHDQANHHLTGLEC